MHFKIIFLIFVLYVFYTTKANITIVVDNGNDEGSFDKGLLSLYLMMDKFVDLVTPNSNKTLYDELILNKKELTFDSSKMNDWKFWTSFYPAITACLVFGVLFFIFMLLFGCMCCCTCCCRCCKCCGNCYDEDEIDSKKGLCAKYILSFFLLFIILIILAGVVCCFMTNKEVNVAVNSPTKYNLQQSLLNTLPLLDQYIKRVFEDLRNNIGFLKNQFLEKLKSTYIDDIFNRVLSSFLIETTYLTNKENITHDLQIINVQASQVEDSLYNMNSSIEMLFQIQENIRSLYTDIPNNAYFKVINERNKISNLNNQISDITEIINGFNFTDEALIKKLKNMELTTKFDQDLETIITNILIEFNKFLNYASNQINILSFQNMVNSYSVILSTYESYRYYVYIGMSTLFLWVVFFSLLGIIFGVCSKNNYGTSAGANCLIASLIMPIISIGMLIQLIIFTGGTIVQSEICVGFVRPSNNSAVKFSNDMMNQFLNTTDLSIITVLQDCQKKESLIKALKLENKINQYMDTVQNTSFNLGSLSVKPLVDAVKIYNDQLVNLLNMNLIIDMTSLMTSVGDLSAFLKLKGDVQNLKNLNDTAKQIQDYLINITAATRVTKLALQDLKSLFVKILLPNFSNDANRKLDQIINIETSNIKQIFSKDLIYSIDQVSKNISNCEPLYNIVTKVISAVCLRTLRPFNGFWFAYGWCLFFFLPLSIISLYLFNLYKKSYLSDRRDYNGMAIRDFEMSKTNQAYNNHY